MNTARPHRLPLVFGDRRRIRVGILGGSFNPAHGGHGHVADLAVRRLGLHELWWMVTPQNPLKKTAGMAPFDDRYASALAQAGRCGLARRMVVSQLEARAGLRHSAETLAMIRRRMPRARLFWVMGADNLAGFHRWHRPGAIAGNAAIAVVNRPGHRAAALASPGARIAGRRMPPGRLAANPGGRRWCFIQGRVSRLSATAIRSRGKGRPKPPGKKTG